jgi:hypothetical protein
MPSDGKGPVGFVAFNQKHESQYDSPNHKVVFVQNCGQAGDLRATALAPARPRRRDWRVVGRARD